MNTELFTEKHNTYNIHSPCRKAVITYQCVVVHARAKLTWKPSKAAVFLRPKVPNPIAQDGQIRWKAESESLGRSSPLGGRVERLLSGVESRLPFLPSFSPVVFLEPHHPHLFPSSETELCKGKGKCMRVGFVIMVLTVFENPNMVGFGLRPNAEVPFIRNAQVTQQLRTHEAENETVRMCTNNSCHLLKEPLLGEYVRV